MLKKLRMWFWTRSQIINHMSSLDRLIDIGIQDHKLILEELEQNKTYHLKLDKGMDPADAMRCLAEIRRRIKWTLPTIIVTNGQFEEASIKELEQAVRQLKKLKKKGGAKYV